MSSVPFTAPMRIASTADASPLTAAQTQFNALVAALEARRDALNEWQTAQQDCLQQNVQVLEPLRRAILQRQREWVLGLAAQLSASDAETLWTRVERRLLERAVCELAMPLVRQTGDLTLKALYNRYSSVDFDESIRAEADELKTLLTDVYGLDMNCANGQTREDMLDHARQQVEREQDRGARRKERRKERLQQQGLNADQQARVMRQKQMAEQTQQTIRDVYRKLASALHPDREPDPAQRERKTALMARVNQAYDNKELLQLLALQLELAHLDANQLTALSEERLRHYNRLLKDQLTDIEREIAQLASSLRHQLQLPHSAEVSAASALPLLLKQIAKAKAQFDEAEAGFGLLGDVPALKRWLKTRAG